MTKKFAAKAIVRTVSAQDEKSFDITLTDAAGRQQTLNVTAELALGMLRALSDFSKSSQQAGPEATKMPKSFAVGTGRYEHVVLIRFEDDAPYGLACDDAAEL